MNAFSYFATLVWSEKFAVLAFWLVGDTLEGS